MLNNKNTMLIRGIIFGAYISEVKKLLGYVYAALTLRQDALAYNLVFKVYVIPILCMVAAILFLKEPRKTAFGIAYFVNAIMILIACMGIIRNGLLGSPSVSHDVVSGLIYFALDIGFWLILTYLIYIVMRSKPEENTIKRP
jgi:hypothetical protein